MGEMRIVVIERMRGGTIDPGRHTCRYARGACYDRGLGPTALLTGLRTHQPGHGFITPGATHGRPVQKG